MSLLWRHGLGYAGVESVIPIYIFIFLVALGVLLDTLLVRTVLVPASLLTIGEHVWWPARPDGAAQVLTRHRTPAAEEQVVGQKEDS